MMPLEFIIEAGLAQANRAADIASKRRAQSIEVVGNMLLARGQDAQRTPGRKSRMWALLTEIDDGNPPRLREVASFGFWAAVVVVLAFAVARC